MYGFNLVLHHLMFFLPFQPAQPLKSQPIDKSIMGGNAPWLYMWWPPIPHSCLRLRTCATADFGITDSFATATVKESKNKYIPNPRESFRSQGLQDSLQPYLVFFVFLSLPICFILYLPISTHLCLRDALGTEVGKPPVTKVSCSPGLSGHYFKKENRRIGDH